MSCNYELQKIDKTIDIKARKTTQNIIPIVMFAMVIVDVSTLYIERYKIKDTNKMLF